MLTGAEELHVKNDPVNVLLYRRKCCCSQAREAGICMRELGRDVGACASCGELPNVVCVTSPASPPFRPPSLVPEAAIFHHRIQPRPRPSIHNCTLFSLTHVDNILFLIRDDDCPASHFRNKFDRLPLLAICAIESRDALPQMSVCQFRSEVRVCVAPHMTASRMH